MSGYGILILGSIAPVFSIARDFAIIIVAIKIAQALNIYIDKHRYK